MDFTSTTDAGRRDGSGPLSEGLGLRAWLVERYENAMAIAARKANADRAGWLEDAAYFKAAVKALDGRTEAVAAERERCARVAEGFEQNRDWVPNSLWDNIRREVAARIRHGPKVPIEQSPKAPARTQDSASCA